MAVLRSQKGLLAIQTVVSPHRCLRCRLRQGAARRVLLVLAKKRTFRNLSDFFINLLKKNSPVHQTQLFSFCNWICCPNPTPWRLPRKTAPLVSHLSRKTLPHTPIPCKAPTSPIENMWISCHDYANYDGKSFRNNWWKVHPRGKSAFSFSFSLHRTPGVGLVIIKRFPFVQMPHTSSRSTETKNCNGSCAFLKTKKVQLLPKLKLNLPLIGDRYRSLHLFLERNIP